MPATQRSPDTISLLSRLILRSKQHTVTVDARVHRTPAYHAALAAHELGDRLRRFSMTLKKGYDKF
jgi:hypothetical protein